MRVLLIIFLVLGLLSCVGWAFWDFVVRRTLEPEIYAQLVDLRMRENGGDDQEAVNNINMAVLALNKLIKIHKICAWCFSVAAWIIVFIIKFQ